MRCSQQITVANKHVNIKQYWLCNCPRDNEIIWQDQTVKKCSLIGILLYIDNIAWFNVSTNMLVF